jgi:quercetin dioxygenase-like cupin family protein
VHFADDEAWHILEGALTFRFSDKVVDAPAGTTVFVPAGVAHDYYEANGSTHYLMIPTPRLHQLIGELHKAPLLDHAAILRRYESAIVEEKNEHNRLD